MSKTPHGATDDELWVASRSVLIDAIELLNEHQDGVTVVGAQAVYLRSPTVDLGVAAATSDADLALDPEVIAGEEPEISALMTGASFSLMDANQPGLWSRNVQMSSGSVPIEVDLLVPEAFAGSGRVSARMPPHHKRTAKRVPGLEGAFVDRERMPISGFGSDERSVQAWVAGPAALLVAKAFKLADRLKESETRPDRVFWKDATDMVRLMRACDAYDVAERWQVMSRRTGVIDVAVQGRAYIIDLFGHASAQGLDLARRNLAGTGVDALDIVPAWMQVFDSETSGSVS